MTTKIPVQLAARAFLYLPLWVAKHEGFFKRTLEENGLPDHEFDLQMPPRPNDLNCVRSLGLLQGQQTPAIGICDPTPLWDSRSQVDGLAAIGTLIGPPPFWLAGVNLPEPAASGTCPDLKDVTRIFLPQADYTGHDLAQLVIKKFGHASIEQIAVPFGTEISNLIAAMEAATYSGEQIAVITADIVNIARLQKMLKGAESLASYAPWCLADYESFRQSVTTSILANKPVLANTAIVKAFLAAVQHASLLINCSELYISDIAQALVADRSNPIDPPLINKIAYADAKATVLPDELHQDEARWIWQQLWRKRIYDPTLRIDWNSYEATTRRRISTAALDELQRIDPRLNREFVDTSAYAIAQTHFPILGRRTSKARHATDWILIAAFAIAFLCSLLLIAAVRPTEIVAHPPGGMYMTVPELSFGAPFNLWHAIAKWSSPFCLVLSVVALAAVFSRELWLHTPVGRLFARIAAPVLKIVRSFPFLTVMAGLLVAGAGKLAWELGWISTELYERASYTYLAVIGPAFVVSTFLTWRRHRSHR